MLDNHRKNFSLVCFRKRALKILKEIKRELEQKHEMIEIQNQGWVKI